VTALPGPPDARTTVVLRRAAALLTRRLEEVLAMAEIDASTTVALAQLVTALALANGATDPERRGELLTTEAMAAKLGVTPKSLCRMLAQGRIAPAVRDGRFLRWRGTETPQAAVCRRGGRT
jgi:hypothetical protein